jgi:hypothetical protein
MILKLKIDVKKIDRSKLFVGEKGTYLDCTILSNKDGVDQYGNAGMIVQDVSKEERLAGVRGAIIGNYKEFTPQGGTSIKHTDPKDSDDVGF